MADNKLKEAQELLERSGFHGLEVRARVRLIKKGVQIDEEIYKRVEAVRAQRDIKVYEALDEALRMWLEHWEARVTPPNTTK